MKYPANWFLLLLMFFCHDGFAQTKPIFTSPTVTQQTPGHRVEINVDISTAKEIYLVASDSGDGISFDWCNWVNPILIDGKRTLDLTQRKWKSASSSFGSVRVNKNCNGGILKMNDEAFSKGFGVHANSVIHFELPKNHSWKKFKVTAGLDNGGTDQAGGKNASVKFLVFTGKPPQKYFVEPRQTGPAANHKLDEVIKQFDVHPELEVGLFAAEPKLVNPTNIDIDHLGRVWVCEVVNYRGRRNSRKEGDRILILEDTDGDAKADRQTVFYQGRDIDSIHGICVLGNRALVSAGSQVFYLIDTDGDARADKKEVLFTGISGTQHDHGIHAFVFGPDGKLYFNFGNSGRQIKDRHGKAIIDVAGQVVDERSRPYQQGMVFRCNLDGSDFETLGWNFRNNWEVCVDSLGRMWQSDNDDDGNRGVRINFVIPFGNYGYRDEITHAGWRSPRTNIEKEIPRRHWHLNDPGVIPNLLQTGGGSPTGICFYEGETLPKTFHHKIVHCDAGPNVVRAYTVEPNGAGFRSKMITIMDGSKHNKWFRPSDVCVAPDGSLLVADWYDPGVGGHGMGDIERGRIFRVTAKGKGGRYVVRKPDLASWSGCLDAMRSCNMATRYVAWSKLMKRRHDSKNKIDEAKRVLIEKMIQHDDPMVAARGLWVIKGLDERTAKKYLRESLFGNRTLLAEVAVKALVQMSDKEFVEKLFLEYCRDAKMIPDNVRRELLLAMSHRQKLKFSDRFALGIIARLKKPNTMNRWLIEVFGIALEKRWDSYLSGHTPENELEQRIIWRSRGVKSLAMIAQQIVKPNLSEEETLRWIRAIDFQKTAGKDSVLKKLAFGSTGKRSESDPKNRIIFREALERISDPSLDVSEMKKVLEFVDSRETSPLERVKLIRKFGIQQRFEQLPSIATKFYREPVGSLAIQTIYQYKQTDRLSKFLIEKQKFDIRNKNQTNEFGKLIEAISRVPKTESVTILSDYAKNESHPLEPRKLTVRRLGDLYGGCETLFQWKESGNYDKQLEPAMVAAVYSARWNDIRNKANKWFPMKSKKGKPLPNVAQLSRRRGNPKLGKVIFAKQGTCATCHVVNGVGKSVGPDLSEIGKKLSKQAMYESLLFPSASISHNYEMWRVTTQEGELIDGVIASETKSELVLIDAKANRITLKIENVDEKVRQKVSIMPDNLRESLSNQQMVDLVEYLMSLKKAR